MMGRKRNLYEVDVKVAGYMDDDRREWTEHLYVETHSEEKAQQLAHFLSREKSWAVVRIGPARVVVEDV